MRSEWAYYKQHFSLLECESIIQKALKIPNQPGTIGSSSINVKNSVRRSSISAITRTKEWIELFDELDRLVADANKQWFNIDYQFLPAIQFAEYSGTDLGFYTRHQDTFLVSPISTHRKLSVTVQLSNPDSYQGGELKFSDVSCQPKSENIKSQGTVCIFPSIIFHEVTPVTEGKRYSLAGWYEGPPWR
jgi:PKHD-type hydroxylase